ncbi:IclR family transcriptional regulator C-terminal domain-containing protein [Pseudomonadota bacterium]
MPASISSAISATVSSTYQRHKARAVSTIRGRIRSEAAPENSATRTLASQGYAFDDEEAEIGVGCIGTIIYDAAGNIAAGLSVSAPIERRRLEWVSDLMQAAQEISKTMGYHSRQGTPD